MIHVFEIKIDQSEAKEILEELKEEVAAHKELFIGESHMLDVAESIIAGLKKNLSEIQ